MSAYTEPEDGAKYYSAETESSGVLLPEYTPLNLALSVNGEECTQDENGVYHAYVGGGSNSLCCDLRGCRQHYGHTHGYRRDPHTGRVEHLCYPRFYRHADAPRKRREGQGRDQRVPAGKQGHHRPDADPFCTDLLCGQGCGHLSNHRHSGCLSEILYGNNNESVYAAGDGSFAIQGTLKEQQTSDALYIRAQDSAGNLSAWQSALVARQVQTYAVTVTTDGNGTASADLAAAAAGTNISLSATPNTGYHFKEWQVISGGVTIENDRFTMPDGDVEVKAIFEKDAAPATPAPTATAKPESSPTPRTHCYCKPNSSPTPAPAATAKPNSGATPPHLLPLQNRTAA